MEEIVKELIRQNKTISAMESCTGGGLANAITSIPDSSKILKFSAVTYSNEFKVIMGVNKDTIDEYSVYSMEVAEEMAYNISSFAKSDYGVGITGKLGKPDPNNPYSDDNTVFISIFDRENDIYYNNEISVVHDNREDNKKQVIDEARKMIYRVLTEKKKNVSK